MTTLPHPANQATTIEEFDREMRERAARQTMTEHEVIVTIGRTLKRDGWKAIGSGRWQSPDGRVFAPHTAVWRGKLLIPAWRVWRDTGELVTTGER